MASFFPRNTYAWKAEEPAAFRKLTMSLLEMGLVTGVVLRLYRAVVVTHGSSDWVYFGFTVALGAAILFGMATAHLANYTVRQWLWRAPLFAALEIVGETVTSIGLTALGREPWGTGRAASSDWQSMFYDLLVWRGVPILVFALLLAGVVQIVRYLLLRGEDRESTVEAVHEENERVEEERERAEKPADER